MEFVGKDYSVEMQQKKLKYPWSLDISFKCHCDLNSSAQLFVQTPVQSSYETTHGHSLRAVCVIVSCRLNLRHQHRTILHPSSGTAGSKQ